MAPSKGTPGGVEVYLCIRALRPVDPAPQGFQFTQVDRPPPWNLPGGYRETLSHGLEMVVGVGLVGHSRHELPLWWKSFSR